MSKPGGTAIGSSPTWSPPRSSTRIWRREILDRMAAERRAIRSALQDVHHWVLFTYHERMTSTIIPADGRETILAAAASALAARGVRLTWRLDDKGEGAGADGDIHVDVDGVQTTLPLQVKAQLRPSTIGLVAAPGERGTLLATAHVTATVGRLLRERGISYVDTAGNAFISAPGIRIEIGGLKPPTTATATPAPLFGRAALPVVLAILNAPQLIDAPLRDIQARTHVSLGSTQKVVKALRSAGYTRAPGRDATRGDREHWHRLLDGWVAAYAGGARDANLLGRYSSDFPIADLVARGTQLPAVLSGEAAASLAGGDLRPATLDLYLHGDLGPLITAARLRPDPAGTISVRKAFWTPLAEADGAGHTPAALAPAPVVYADLIALADPRTQEAARRWLKDDPNLRSFLAD
jgi:hypothetical protein